MTAVMEELEERPIKQYTFDEYMNAVKENNLDDSDVYILAALYSTVFFSKGELHGLKTQHRRIVFISNGDTGIYRHPGMVPTLLVNVADIPDYDRVSQLTDSSEADIYLLLAEGTWSEDSNSVTVLDEWFRMDVYPEPMSIEGVKND